MKKKSPKQRNKNTKKSNDLALENSGFFTSILTGRPKLLSIILIGIIALIAYSNTFRAEMQFDDTLQIVANQEVNHLGNFTSLSDWSNFNKRPLAFFSFAINYFFDGYHVYGYHLVNLLIHMLTAYVLFLLSRFIFARIFPSREQAKVNLAALFTALLFVSHPIQTQAVTYIIQRMTSLSTLFYLTAVLSYAYGRRSQIEEGLKKAIIYYSLTLIAFILSLMSKQIAVTLPFALLLFEFFFIRGRDGKLFGKYILGSFIVLIAGTLAFILLGYLPRETEDITRHDYLITQFRVIAKYFQLLILPIHQNLDYNFTLSNALTGWKELLSLGFIVGLWSVAIYLRKKEPLFSFGIFWIFLTLSVESSIIPISDVIFEHRLYLPMAGFAILVSGLMIKYLRPKLLYPVLIIVLVTLTTATWSRNRIWKTQVSLWTDVTKKSPDYGRPWYNLGKVSYENGKLNDCIRYTKKSIEIEPDNPKAWYNIGLCYEKQAKVDLAVRFYEKSLDYDPGFGRSLNNLGSIYIDKKEYGQAVEWLRKALDKDAKQPSILQNLAIAYYHMGDYLNAIKYNKKYLKIKPENADILSDVGLSYMQLKKYKSAIEWYDKALVIDPNKTNTLIDLGSCYFQTGNYKAAASNYQKALRVEPGNQLAGKYLEMAKKRIR